MIQDQPIKVEDCSVESFFPLEHVNSCHDSYASLPNAAASDELDRSRDCMTPKHRVQTNFLGSVLQVRYWSYRVALVLIAVIVLSDNAG